MSWTRAHSLGAGLGLILLVNAIALGGVYFNRAGEPDSRLLLSERELTQAYNRDRKENTGIALDLIWRRPSAKNAAHAYEQQLLSLEKMAELGFRTPVDSPTDQAMDIYKQQLSREVLVVLELDGPAHMREVRLLKNALDKARQALKATPRDKERQERLTDARKALEQEQRHASRLFAIDVGLHRQTLRQRYGDRQRYAIVRATVRPWIESYKNRKIGGRIMDLSIERLNLPSPWRAQFTALQQSPYRQETGERVRYQVEARFGQRLEPWISAVPQFGE